MAIAHEIRNDYEAADALVNLLIGRATGESVYDDDFQYLRDYFIKNSELERYLPAWFRSKRSLNQFWNFIKMKFHHYVERREFLWSEFEPLLLHLETGSSSPVEEDILAGLQLFNSEEITRSWKRMLERFKNDPEGAITASRNLLETVFKHILDARKIEYDHDKIELPDLYKKISKELNLAPELHREPIFKQILGGCSGVVTGLGALRNRLGDAHGKSAKRVRPSERHAKLAVNLSGSMALFFAETYKKEQHNQSVDPTR
ncbi:MAG: abortive infection family protein [Verrucomicrobiota bacterium]